MFKKIVCTSCDPVGFILRVTLAVVMFPHGAQKALGWFGGPGFSGMMDIFTQKMGVPYVFALLAIAAEFLGSIGVFVGFLTRIAAFGIAVTMIVAIYMAHWQNGFFMNWYNLPNVGHGYEYHLLVIGICLALMCRGAGGMSVDAMLTKKCTRGSGACCGGTEKHCKSEKHCSSEKV